MFCRIFFKTQKTGTCGTMTRATSYWSLISSGWVSKRGRSIAPPMWRFSGGIISTWCRKSSLLTRSVIRATKQPSMNPPLQSLSQLFQFDFILFSYCCSNLQFETCTFIYIYIVFNIFSAARVRRDPSILFLFVHLFISFSFSLPCIWYVYNYSFAFTQVWRDRHEIFIMGVLSLGSGLCRLFAVVQGTPWMVFPLSLLPPLSPALLATVCGFCFVYSSFIRIVSF